MITETYKYYKRSRVSVKIKTELLAVGKKNIGREERIFFFIIIIRLINNRRAYYHTEADGFDVTNIYEAFILNVVFRIRLHVYTLRSCCIAIIIIIIIFVSDIENPRRVTTPAETRRRRQYRVKIVDGVSNYTTAVRHCPKT